MTELKMKYASPETPVLQMRADEDWAGESQLNLGSVNKDPDGLGGSGSQHPVQSREMDADMWDTEWEE